MRMFIMIMAFAMNSCATAPPIQVHKCPELPQIGDQETMRDYVLRIISLYRECEK